jgi:KaiC/GvpD/RAD55 family RecA-like ATPase
MIEMLDEPKESKLQDNAKRVMDALSQLIEKAKSEEGNDVSNPFTFPIETKIDNLVIKPSTYPKTEKKLCGFTTYTFLDNMFLDSEEKTIGLPICSNTIISGLPSSGKSLFIEELALQVANSGKKICFTTSEEVWRTENGRFDLEARLKERAKFLGLDWQKISQNLFVLDTVSCAELRQFDAFIGAYRNLVEKEHIELSLIDSITMLEDSRGMVKYRLGALVKYNQLHGVTSIMVSQRATDDSDSMSLSGGLALSHIVDILMELDYKKLSSWDSTIKVDTGIAQGQIAYFFRIMKNRLSRFKANYFAYTINKNGLVRLNQKP